MPALTLRVACAMLSLFVLAGPALAATPQPAPAKTALPAKPGQPKPKPLPPGVVVIQVADLHCKTCARKLAGKLFAVPGVVRVATSLKQDTATITLQKKKPAAPAALWNAAIASGQQPVELRVLASRLIAKDFPKAKTAVKTPHATPAKR